MLYADAKEVKEEGGVINWRGEKPNLNLIYSLVLSRQVTRGHSHIRRLQTCGYECPALQASYTRALAHPQVIPQVIDLRGNTPRCALPDKAGQP
jgi:hypothetical protein